MLSSLNRISALLMRHLYLLRSSGPRLLDLVYWPTLEILVWGFFSSWMATHDNSSLALSVAAFLLGAVMMWEVLLRSQFGVTMSFFEEIWSRNLGHLFVAPLRPWEWVMAMMGMGIVRMVVGMVPAFLLAFFLYEYNILDVGLPLVGYFINLVMMGWWMGFIVIAMILRWGLGAEGMAWMIPFMLAPLACIYYPVAGLPDWLQPVALALPAAHVFEGMRDALSGGGFDLGRFAWAFGLNVFYAGIAVTIFNIAFRHARQTGKLLQTGE
ncbi:MAG: ABC transporter permease [Alphaproteobacteria bacterium]